MTLHPWGKEVGILVCVKESKSTLSRTIWRIQGYGLYVDTEELLQLARRLVYTRIELSECAFAPHIFNYSIIMRHGVHTLCSAPYTI
jgi:hypothetical protein